MNLNYTDALNYLKIFNKFELNDANIEHSILAGDISEPALYAKNLKLEFIVNYSKNSYYSI